MASDDDFDMSRYSSSGYSSAEVRPHPSHPRHTPPPRRRDGTNAKLQLRGAMSKARQSSYGSSRDLTGYNLGWQSLKKVRWPDCGLKLVDSGVRGRTSAQG